MIGRTWVRAAAAGLALLVGAHSGAAQNYDGDTLIRFGAFGQGAFTRFGQTKPAIASGTASGLEGGFSAGIDFSPHRYWTWGIEIDAAVGDGRSTINGVNYGVDYLANLRGRFGVWVAPQWMIYGSGGVSLLSFEAGLPQASSLKAAETVGGLTVGLGTEFRWNYFSLFGEYNFANFAGREFTLGGVRHEVDADVHSIRVGVKFNVGHDYHSDIGRHYDPLK